MLMWSRYWYVRVFCCVSPRLVSARVQPRHGSNENTLPGLVSTFSKHGDAASHYYCDVYCILRTFHEAPVTGQSSAASQFSLHVRSTTVSGQRPFSHVGLRNRHRRDQNMGVVWLSKQQCAGCTWSIVICWTPNCIHVVQMRCMSPPVFILNMLTFVCLRESVDTHFQYKSIADGYLVIAGTTLPSFIRWADVVSPPNILFLVISVLYPAACACP